MKTALFGIVLLSYLMITESFGQNAAAKEAIRNNIGYNGIYSAEIPRANIVTCQEFSKWYKKNSDEYIVVDYELESRWVGGMERLVVRSFDFRKRNQTTSEFVESNENWQISSRDYINAYVAAIKTQKKKKKLTKAAQDVYQIAASVGLTYILFETDFFAALRGVDDRSTQERLDESHRDFVENYNKEPH